MSEKYKHYRGLKFTRDDKTGYYLNSTHRKRLHRYVVECEKGEIPKGYHVHHIDGDKSNNDISNLKLMKAEEHVSLHSVESEQGQKNVESGLLDSIRPLTKEWHASQEGHEWHKKHYEEMKEKLYQEKEFVCKYCGKTYKAINNGNNSFCSNACRSAWRRASGVDDEERICVICGKKFTVNKYSKAKCCSKKCGASLRSKNKVSEVSGL